MNDPDDSRDNKTLDDKIVDMLPDTIVPPATSGKGKVDLTQGSIEGHVLRMLLPFAIAVMALLSAGIVDTIYLGNLTGPDGGPELGTLALAAVGFAYPLTFLGNSVNIGLGAGTMSALSRAIGGGDIERARRHAAASILLALFVMSLTVLLIWAVLPYAFDFLGAKGQTRSMAEDYLLISLPGLVIVSIAMISNNILRAGGEAMLPSSIMILGAILNIIIDPFLIFGWGPFPRMEVQGAAIATVLGNTIAAIFGFYIVTFRRKAVDFAKMTMASIRHAWWIIGQVGMVAAVTNVVVPLGTFFAVAAVQRAGGDTFNAAFTLTSRAELISVGLLYGLSACIGAVTGQNGGAGLTSRVEEAFRVCYRICVYWSIGMAIVLAVLAESIAGLFTNDPEVLELAKSYFWIVPITIAGYGFVFVTSAGFNALGRPFYGLVFTIIRSLVLYAPLVAIGVNMDGLRGAFIGIAIANIVSGFLARTWTLRWAPMTAKKS